MKATVYSTNKCVWCDRVITLLKSKEIETEKIDVTKDGQLQEMHKAAGSRVNTVPQVIIDGAYIGGYTETERFINKNLSTENVNG
jgi:glutaredoxin